MLCNHIMLHTCSGLRRIFDEFLTWWSHILVALNVTITWCSIPIRHRCCRKVVWMVASLKKLSNITSVSILSIYSLMVHYGNYEEEKVQCHSLSDLFEDDENIVGSPSDLSLSPSSAGSSCALLQPSFWTKISLVRFSLSRPWSPLPWLFPTWSSSLH